jgi:hypothetical protein
VGDKDMSIQPFAQLVGHGAEVRCVPDHRIVDPGQSLDLRRDGDAGIDQRAPLAASRGAFHADDADLCYAIT